MNLQSSEQRRVVLAIDPGSVKCGMAVVAADGEPGPMSSTSTLMTKIAATERLLAEIGQALRDFPEISAVIMGDGTQHRSICKAAGQMFPLLPLVVVDEHGTSQEARARYLQEHPARGLRKLLPMGLRAPEFAYDDIVATILGEKYFQTQRK